MGALILSADANPGTASWENPLVAAVTLATGTAIPVTQSASFAFSVAAAGETNTLAAPTFSGQQLALYASSVAGGASRVVTVANAVNQTGNNTLTFAASADSILLIGIEISAGTFRWRVVANDGVALSTV